MLRKSTTSDNLGTAIRLYLAVGREVTTDQGPAPAPAQNRPIQVLAAAPATRRAA